MADAKRDANYITTLLAVSNVDGTTPVTLYADPITHRLLVSSSTNVETPTEIVNGVNTTFTVTNEPKFIIADGIVRFSGFGYTYTADTIEVDPLIPPTSFIRSIY